MQLGLKPLFLADDTTHLQLTRRSALHMRRVILIVRHNELIVHVHLGRDYFQC